MSRARAVPNDDEFAEVRQGPVARVSRGDPLPAPLPITQTVITAAFSAFVAECGAAFSAEGLVEALGADLTALEGRGLPLREHLRACDGALSQRLGGGGLLTAQPGAEHEQNDQIGEVHKDTIRLHTLGMCLFHSLLYDLLNGLELGPIDAILSPGCERALPTPSPP